MPQMQFSVDINRPPEAVFAYMTDTSKLPEWQGDVVEARWEGQPGRGARLKQVRNFQGKQTDVEMEVTEYEPGRRFAMRTLSGHVGFDLQYTFEPRNGGTRVNFSGQVEPSGAMKLAGPLLGRRVEKQFKSNFETLKQRLESGG